MSRIPLYPFVACFALGIALAGCGGQAHRARRTSPISFRDIQYAAAVYNAYSPRAYLLFGETIRAIKVTPSSSAQLIETVRTPARFASGRDRRHWRASGSPALWLLQKGKHVRSLPAGNYTFMPQGTPFTFRDAKLMPTSPAAVRAVVEEHLRPYAGRVVPMTLILKAFGFLLGTAPLPPAAFAATRAAATGLPGVRDCGPGTDGLGRRGRELCVADAHDQIEVLFCNGGAGVLAVSQRTRARSQLLVGLKPGTIVVADTFTR